MVSSIAEAAIAGNLEQLDYALLMGYTAEMLNIGRRVVVYGTTGSGKTTVAARIAQCLGVPHIELDAIFWLPDWTEKPREEFRAEVSALLERYREGWVCDGNYNALREITLPRTDAVVWLWLPIGAVHDFIPTDTKSTNSL